MSYGIDITLCECLKRTVYAKGRCFICYRNMRAKVTTKPINHGTVYAATIRKCSCTPCVEASRDYQRDWRARRRADLAVVTEAADNLPTREKDSDR